MPLAEKRRKKGRERRAPGRPGVWCGSWAYWDTYPIRRWKGKRENVEEGRSCHRKEGRKEGKELFGATGNRINAAKTPGLFQTGWDYVRLETIIVAPIRFRSVISRSACESSFVDQSLFSKPKQDLLGRCRIGGNDKKKHRCKAS